jgi:methionyl aminopeptidase
MMNEETIQKCIKAGKVASQVRREGAAKLKVPGTKILEVMDFCEKRILELGGGISWAQYALNDTAAHSCPAEDNNEVTKPGDVIKIDIGVHIDGWIADNAMTVEVETKNYVDMIKASQNALKAAIKIVRPGVKINELGAAQASEAEALGFRVIRNLGGHTLEQFRVHGGISIPFYDNGDKRELKEGWQIAIEPFVTNGGGMIKEKGTSTIFMVARKNPSARTAAARKILQEVAPQNGMPFTSRWLTRKFGRGTALLGLRELERTGIISSHPPLVEVSGGIVTQFEHSMVVKDKPIVYTRHGDDEW